MLSIPAPLNHVPRIRRSACPAFRNLPAPISPNLLPQPRNLVNRHRPVIFRVSRNRLLNPRLETTRHRNPSRRAKATFLLCPASAPAILRNLLPLPGPLQNPLRRPNLANLPFPRFPQSLLTWHPGGSRLPPLTVCPGLVRNRWKLSRGQMPFPHVPQNQLPAETSRAKSFPARKS